MLALCKSESWYDYMIMAMISLYDYMIMAMISLYDYGR